MSSGPINPLILAGDEVIQKWRTLMGPTNTYKYVYIHLHVHVLIDVHVHICTCTFIR